MPDAVVVCVILLAIACMIWFASYNALTQHRQDVRVAWSKMDDELKTRYYLVSKLIDIVQPVGGDTAAMLAAVTIAKNQAAVAFNPVQLAQAESALSAGIRKVLSASDQQAELNDNPRFTELRTRLRDTEASIEQAVLHYNDKVDSLNASMNTFPYVVTARLISLQAQPMFGMDLHAT